jgi:hypothetical protein
MDYDYQKLSSGFVTVLMLGVGIYQTYLQRRQVQLMTVAPKSKKASMKPVYWPTLVIVTFGIAIAWTPFFLPQTADEHPLMSWGPLGSRNTLGVVANGRAVWSKRDDFRLAGVMFHYSGAQDKYDVSGLSKSRLYDIEHGSFPIVIQPTANFLDENHRGLSGTTYLLLLVPQQIGMSQFETIHEAQRLGVIVLDGGEGPP